MFPGVYINLHGKWSPGIWQIFRKTLLKEKKWPRKLNSRKILHHLAQSPTWWFVPSLSYNGIYIYHMYIPHHKKSPSPKSSQRRWLQDFVHFCFSLTTRSAESFGARVPDAGGCRWFFLREVPFALRIVEPGDPAPKYLGYQTIWWYIQGVIRRKICTNIDNILHFCIILLLSTFEPSNLTIIYNHHPLFDLVDLQILLNIGGMSDSRRSP